MPAIIITSTTPLVGNLWRNARRKKDGYDAYQVVKFRIERTPTHGYRLTPQAPCSGPVLEYADMTALKLYWDWWSNEHDDRIDYTQRYP